MSGDAINSTTLCVDGKSSQERSTPGPNQTEPMTVRHRLPLFASLQGRHISEAAGIDHRYHYIFAAGHNNLAPSIPEWHIPDRTRFVEARAAVWRTPYSVPVSSQPPKEQGVRIR